MGVEGGVARRWPGDEAVDVMASRHGQTHYRTGQRRGPELWPMPEAREKSGFAEVYETVLGATCPTRTAKENFEP